MNRKKNYDFSKGAAIKGKIKSKKQVEKALSDQQKVLTSIRLDRDVVIEAKRQATAEKVGYLTWINKKLRESILKEESVEVRLERLEKEVFKK